MRLPSAVPANTQNLHFIFSVTRLAPHIVTSTQALNSTDHVVCLTAFEEMAKSENSL